ncbi:MAG: hypothetical protein JNJ54_03940 [Myxococcaceae bacterium]|nr:hypothetical protein [Myxococcaceae bacterium]
MTVLLVAVVLAAPPQPKLDWSLFPEGTTELRHLDTNNKKGSRVVTNYRVTRTGPKTVIDVERTSTSEELRVSDPPKKDGEKTVSRFEAAAPTEPAVSGTTKLDWRCVKQRAVVHSSDMRFLGPEHECDGGFVRVRSKQPRKVSVLECQTSPDDERRLTFVPGKVLEYQYEDNDCTLAEGLRFPK